MTMTATAPIGPEHWAAPRFATPRDETRRTLGGDVAEVAASFGWPLLGWQRQVADVTSELTDEDRFAYPVVLLTVPRQCGKTALVFSTMAERAKRLTDHRAAYAAQTGQDGRRLFREEWCPRIEAHEARRWRIRRSNGEEALTYKATNGIVRPFPPVPGALHNSQSDLAVIDEGWKHDPTLGAELLQAAVPTQTTRKRRQLWLVSTAGPPSSVWFRRWIERGRNGEGGIAYFEWSAESVDDADDEDRWPLVHPALGELVTLQDLRDFRDALGREGFARAYLNVWPELPVEGATSSPLDVDTWANCLDPTATILGAPVFSADADPLAHVGVIAAAGRSAKGHHVEVVESRLGTVWLPDRLTELVGKHGGVLALDEGGPVGWVAEELGRRRVPYVPIKPAAYARGCAQLSDAARAGLLSHPESGSLDAAVAGAERRNLGGGWAWDRKRSTADIAPLVAVSLAFAGAVADVEPEASRVF